MREKYQYLDAKVFDALVRPQYGSGCSIASITTAMRYFTDNDHSQEDVAKLINIDITSSKLGPGNRKVSSWMKEAAAQVGLKIRTKILFEGGWYLESEENDNNWKYLKSVIADPSKFAILHIEGHYAPITGYGVFRDSPNGNMDEGNRWIIVADPSPLHGQSNIADQHHAISPPIWSIRWGVLQDRFSRISHYGILEFEKS